MTLELSAYPCVVLTTKCDFFFPLHACAPFIVLIDVAGGNFSMLFHIRRSSKFTLRSDRSVVNVKLKRMFQYRKKNSFKCYHIISYLQCSIRLYLFERTICHTLEHDVRFACENKIKIFSFRVGKIKCIQNLLTILPV